MKRTALFLKPEQIKKLQMLSDKLHYLSRVASYVVFSGSLPRDVGDDFDMRRSVAALRPL